ncbi:MAG: gamma carbonic anhydrase family protein [Promethearchaeota archaeon]
MIIKSPLNDKKPNIHPNSFIAPNAVIIGDVEISEGVNIWFSAVIRADWGMIKIMENTSVHDNCTIYAAPYSTVIIGENCIIGHNSCIHGPCKIGNNVKVGVNASILPNTNIQSNIIIKAGSVVKEGMFCRSNTLYGGNADAEIIKIYRSEMQVISQVTMESAFYIENCIKFKEFFKEKK